MLKDIPIIRSFAYNGKHHVYDAYTNQLLSVSKDQYIEICQLQKIGVEEYRIQKKDTQAYKDILMMMHSGFFHSSFINMVEHPSKKYIPYMLDRCICFLQLQITRDCNFKCRYCLFTRDHDINRHHEKVNMPWEVAKQSIDFLFDHSQESQNITITFFGGEPLLNFKLIKVVVDYAEKKFISKGVSYSLTTNGSILDDQMIDFFISHDFDLLISLDGSEEIQNQHRKFYENGMGTFNIVFKNALKIRDRDSEYFYKHVMFVPVLFADENENAVLEFYNNNGITSTSIRKQYANIQGIDYIHNSNEGLMNLSKENQIKEMSNEQISGFDEIFNDKSPIQAPWHHSGSCIPGIVRLFVNVHGDFYPCERVIETPALSLGNVYQGFDVIKVSSLANIARITEKECKQCWAIRFCAMCAMHCTDSTKDEISHQMKLTYCNIQKKLAEVYLKTKC